MVAGPPGTGKTVIALYRAKLMSDMGKPVRLLMYSRLLSQYTEAAICTLGLDSVVEPYFAWFWHFYRKHYKKNPPQVAAFWYDWPEILQTVALNPPPKNSLPYLLVDEGQDMPREFYVVAGHLSRHLTVFADENQSLFKTNSCPRATSATALGTEVPVHWLTRNYRNSAEIAALAATFHTGMKTGIAKPPTRQGDRPIIKAFGSFTKTVQFIAQYETQQSGP